MQLFSVQRLQRVASTNDEVKRAIDAGVAEGYVCRADEQTGGYGRQGRTWSSPKGGSYQSLLLRPAVAPQVVPTIGLVAALAVRDALIEAGGLGPDFVKGKWPNDVVCSAGKLAGISSELHAGAVCIGIGVNVHAPTPRPEVTGKYTPAYLEDHAGVVFDPHAIGDAVLESFEGRYRTWLEEGFAAFCDEFNACSWLVGKSVRIADIHGVVLLEGLAQGVDPAGRLLVQTPSGLKPALSGEVHIL